MIERCGAVLSERVRGKCGEPGWHRAQSLGLQHGQTRANLFNQTDVTGAMHTGSVKHALLVGAELGRQVTDNFRETGYFNGTATSSTALRSE